MDSRTRARGYVPLEGSSTNTLVSQLAQQDQVPWYSKPNLRLLYLLMIPTCLAVNITTGFDGSMINGLQAVPSWLEFFHHPRSASLGIMSAMFSLGSLGALPFVSLVVDKSGRRCSILLGGMISVTGAILQGSASNFEIFMFSRFLLGFADTWSVVAASSLIGELSHPKERAVIGCLFHAAWELGAISAAAVTLTTFTMTNNWGWRIPSYLQALPSMLQIAFISFLPESPRWLVSKHRNTEAYAVLVKYHAEGDENSDFVKAEYNQIEQILEAELRISQTSHNEAFSAPGMQKRLFIASFLGLFTQWSGNGLLSYYLSPILDGIGIRNDRTKHIINLSRAFWSSVNVTTFSFIVPRYPRRSVFLACAISVFVVFTAWTIASAEYSFSQSKTAAQIVVTLMFLYSLAYNPGFHALPYTFLVELFPFHVRARGLTIYQSWVRVASFVNQFLNPIGLDTLGWKWYIPYCMWIAFEVVFIYFMFPETSGRTLEELTFLFENEQEAYGRAEVEILCEQLEGESETYGSMDARGPRAPTKRPDEMLVEP